MLRRMLRPAPGLRQRVLRQWRWPVVIVGLTGLLLLPSIVAAWPVDEPEIDVATLVDRIEASATVQYQGLFESRGGVRVPDLGRYEEQVAMFTETTRVRAWYVDQEHWRADELTPGGETGWYREPGGLWRWRTGRQQVVFATREATEPARFPRAMDLSPPELGRRIVDEAFADDGSPNPALAVTEIDARRVAGRTAAGLRITPTDPASSTIHAVDVWADPESGVVLRVEIETGGTAPIFETGWLDFSLDAPAADVVAFDPDETGVRYRSSTTMDALETLDSVGFPLPDTIAGLTRRAGSASGVQTYGDGFTIVSAFAVPQGVLPRSIRGLPTSERPWGGRAIVIEAGLVNALVVSGAGFSYLMAGTVPIAVLDRMAEELAGAEA